MPAIGSVNVSKPATLAAFDALNDGKPYEASIKPFNFLITAQTANDQIPPTVEGAFQLVAPWTNQPDQWLNANWINKNSAEGRVYQAVTGPVEDPDTQVTIRTFADVLADYRVHPEPKSLAPDGSRSGWHTKGLLRRRPVKASRLVLIGKESNQLEETLAGLDLGESEQSRQSAKPGDAWRALVKPILAQMPLGELARRSELGPTALKAARSGRSLPHPRNQRLLLTIGADWAGGHLRHWGVVPPSLPIDRCAAYLKERPGHTDTKTCPVCGGPVDNPRRTYCGSACKQQAHRARHFDAT